MQSNAKRIALCGLLGALALVLSFLEGMLPPLPGLPPGAKPGLSNIVTMFAAGSLGLPYALAVAVIKGGFAFLTRGVTAGLMSLSGGVLSTLMMWAVWKKTRFSLLFTGVCGALAHNAAQLAVALLLTGPAALFYIPALLLLSVGFGLCSGLVLRLILPALTKLGLAMK
ncbi:MAG: Gx transporter family protein [Hominenteromicrobium sp.]